MSRLSILVTDLKRLPNGKVLMTSGDAAYGDEISFEISEQEYKLKMEGNETWHASIDESYFIELCKQLIQCVQ